MQQYQRGFASDNNAGVHPDIFAAMAAVNQGHTVAYGSDPYTALAQRKFKIHFGEDTVVFLVFNGTAANVLAISALVRPFEAVICARTAHINEDECGAPEKFGGCKLLALPTHDGKISVEQIRPLLHSRGFEHHVQPKLVSITQPTELGTVYSVQELTAIADFAHRHGMYVHMDGARLANAAASFDASLRAVSRDTGVDVISFGGTKNGMMYGEAVIFFDHRLADNFQYIRKQGMQLASKMRFIAAQFEALLSNDLWLLNARQANAMARLLAERLGRLPAIRITQPVQVNSVFAMLPSAVIPQLQKRFFFYVWNQQTSEVRWMTSFDTTEQDVFQFAALLQKLLS